MLLRFGETAYLDIELKVAGNEEAVVSAISAKPPGRGYVVSSFLPEVLRRLHELDPSLPLGYICERPEDLPHYRELPIAVFIPQYKLLTQELMGRCVVAASNCSPGR